MPAASDPAHQPAPGREGEGTAPAADRPEPLAVVGVGRMGAAVAGRLLSAGHPVAVHDTRREAAAALEAAGARWRGSPAEAAREAAVLLTVLPGPREVEAAMAGPGGALAGLRPGAAWIDLSTSDPALTRELAARARAAGAAVLDAPMGGDPAAAARGELELFVGGPAEELARRAPLLAVLAAPERIHHVGPAGAGHTAKLLANFVWFAQALATTEALALGARSGLEPETLRRALAASSAGGRFLDHDAPALLRGDLRPAFGVHRCHEQLQVILARADDLGVPLDMVRAVERAYAAAVERFGAADGELLPARVVEQRAGVRLVGVDQGRLACPP